MGGKEDLQFGTILTLEVGEIDQIVKALGELKDEIIGNNTDSFKIITDN